MKRAAMMGPMIKPRAPNMKIPPKVATKISKSGMSVSGPVSETHLKLSTIYCAELSVVAV